jgi:general stress protein CsbA
MKPADGRTGIAPDFTMSARMGAGSWIILIVLFSLLAATLVVVYLGWTRASDADVPASGYVAMALGLIVSLAVGFGLMALIFYSSRKGYDEPPVVITPDRERSESRAVSKIKK